VARTTLAVVAGVAVLYACATLAGERLRFGGTDDRASSAIAESRPEYRRWVSPLWAPGSRAAEVLLFGLQALAGAGVLGWAIARLRGRGAGDAEGAEAAGGAGDAGATGNTGDAKVAQDAQDAHDARR
jgi:cobalt/nickel transport protein